MIHYHRYLSLSEQGPERSLSVIAAGYTAGESHISDTYSRSRPNVSWPPLHPPGHAFVWRDGRTLSEYQLIYVTRGSALFESKTCGLRHLEAGDLFALFPGEWHRYGATVPEIIGARKWDYYWVAFTGRLAAEYVAECQLSVAEPIIKVGLDKRLIEEYLGITDEMRELAAGYQEIMAAHTLMILAHAKATSLRKVNPGSEMIRLMERAKGLMLERIDQAPDLEEMADSLGMSYTWFRKMFRQHTGMSPAQYHLQYRIGRARELLTNTDLPIATIGESLGFKSSHHFSDLFKKKIGYSPRDFRDRAQVPLIPK